MLPALHLMVLTWFVTSLAEYIPPTNSNETQAKKMLISYNIQVSKVLIDLKLKLWESRVDLGKNKISELVDLDFIVSKIKRYFRRRASTFNVTKMSNDTRRQLLKIRYIDMGFAGQKKETLFKELGTVVIKMNALFNGVTYNLERRSLSSSDSGVRRSLSVDDGQFITSPLNPREKTSEEMKKLFTNYVNLSKEAVNSIGYSNLGKMWSSHYGFVNIEKEMDRLYKEIRPLYVQLHAYVRTRLKTFWGTDFPQRGHIPESVLEGIPGDTWPETYSKVKPFKRRPNVFHFKKSLDKQNYTVQKMFKTAEDFLTSMGFDKMSPSFWERSVFEREYGAIMDCQPSAWDFYDGKDFRIKTCREVSASEFVSAHYQMGRLAYFMAYKDQPFIYRAAPNPAFLEAMGGMFGLSVLAPVHLKKRGLISDVPTDNETNINMLMYQALSTVAYIPMTYFAEKWRFLVFRGDIKEEDYLTEWNRLRCLHTGISPIEIEDNEQWFLPGLMSQIPNGVPLIRYFLGFFLQFHFHVIACREAGYKGLRIKKCDIYNSTAAGNKLKEMMRLGSSMPWHEVLFKYTGRRTIDSRPLVRYFTPLLRFLRKQNGKVKEWKETCG